MHEIKLLTLGPLDELTAVCSVHSSIGVEKLQTNINSLIISKLSQLFNHRFLPNVGQLLKCCLRKQAVMIAALVIIVISELILHGLTGLMHICGCYCNCYSVQIHKA